MSRPQETYTWQTVEVPVPVRDRYAQCDGTCTVDCGACKGAGRPSTVDVQRDLAAELAEHQGLVGPRDPDRPDVWFRWCICGWDGGPLPRGEASNDQHSHWAHVAAALLPSVGRLSTIARIEGRAESLNAEVHEMEDDGDAQLLAVRAIQWEQEAAELRAALASPAPAPHGEEGQR